MDVQKAGRKPGADGSSLVGLLLIVVVLGGLTATAIVGVSSLTGSGNNIATIGTSGSVANTSTTAARSRGIGIAAGINAAAVSACKASAAAASSASTVYYATSGGAYPVKWSDLADSSPPIYALPTNVVINTANPTELDGRAWKMVMSGGGTTAPSFACSSRPAPAP